LIDLAPNCVIESTMLTLAEPAPQRRRLRSLPALALAAALVFAGLWFAREPLLRGAAHLWIVSDPISDADAVAVLGGGLEVRPFAAAELYKRGLVKKVLLSRVPEARSTRIGGIPGHSELNRMLLLNLGVPETSIEMFGHENRSTWDEAAALREWADQHRALRIVAPTDIFSARRVRWIFDRKFAGSSVRVEIPSFEAPGYTRAAWWQTEAGMIAFQNEIMKYLYYRLKY
jgi:uncharacterized SAM-binding protein YcdF (DUF218 family)